MLLAELNRLGHNESETKETNISRSLYDELSRQMRARRIKVREDELDNCKGRSYGGEVVVDQRLTPQDKLRTLTHEYGHELIHWPLGERKPDDADAEEMQAELLAHFVMRELGFREEVGICFPDLTTALQEAEKISQLAQQITRDLRQHICLS